MWVWPSSRATRESGMTSSSASIVRRNGTSTLALPRRSSVGTSILRYGSASSEVDDGLEGRHDRRCLHDEVGEGGAQHRVVGERLGLGLGHPADRRLEVEAQGGLELAGCDGRRHLGQALAIHDRTVERERRFVDREPRNLFGRRLPGRLVRDQRAVGVADHGMERAEVVEHEQQVVGRRPELRTATPVAGPVAALVEHHAATSVVDVQQRAGVSRGALQHYWPSRAALVVDAVKAVFDSMAARLRADMAAGATAVVDANPSRRIRLAIELLWSSFDSSLFRAELELWVAARHDAELRPLVVAHDRRLATEISQLCRDMFGRDLAAHAHFDDATRLLTQCMRGAALVVDLHPKSRPQLVPEWHRQTCLALGVSPGGDR